MTARATQHPRRRTLWLALGVLLMLATLAIALLPATRQLTAMARVLPQGDKLLHALAFAVLMTWWGNVFRDRAARWRIAAACLLFGGLIECAQWPFDPDDADPLDLLADALGLLVGQALLRTRLAGLLAGLERVLVRAG